MSDPFKIDGPTCISFSGGRTSAYMLWRVLQSNGGLPQEAKVCFANTGKEEEATLSFVRDCSTHWNVPIIWLEYMPEAPKFKVVSHGTAARNGEPFEALVLKRKYLPNPISRFCTSEMKILTIDRYMKSIGMDDYETMVGIRFDEKRRAAKLRDSKLTPLIDAGVTQQDVQDFWKSNAFNLNLTFRGGVTALGNCDLCFLKGPNQILSLIRDNPSRAVWWAKQEKAINGTFRNDRPSYSEMLTFAQQQTDMFDTDEEGIDCFCGD